MSAVVDVNSLRESLRFLAAKGLAESARQVNEVRGEFVKAGAIGSSRVKIETARVLRDSFEDTLNRFTSKIIEYSGQDAPKLADVLNEAALALQQELLELGDRHGLGKGTGAEVSKFYSDFETSLNSTRESSARDLANRHPSTLTSNASSVAVHTGNASPVSVAIAGRDLTQQVTQSSEMRQIANDLETIRAAIRRSDIEQGRKAELLDTVEIVDREIVAERPDQSRIMRWASRLGKDLYDAGIKVAADIATEWLRKKLEG